MTQTHVDRVEDEDSASLLSHSNACVGRTKPRKRSLKSTPATASSGRSKAKPAKAPVQLIGDLPRAEDEAMTVFTEIPGNHYQYGTLGKSREALESMTCDCQYDHGVDDPDAACGPDSDCINRLTQVECMSDDCKCRTYCQNQRFQRKQYAPIEIVKTEMKGFGLRAAEDIPKDAFIYEYVGDVVSQPSFLKRMRKYAEEGIRHFYFMMLQKDEFIDATKRGGIGRFANHSCNPNCYVAKWTVGDYVRMGIFANRTIRKHEELTFNYNVDRYGHDAQPCYCGEPNCVGFIGGKTQTDLAAMDDLYLDALGITEEVEALGLKGTKKKKGKKLDVDFIPDLKPIALHEVPKVVQAMRQTTSRKVLVKLLMRTKLTEDLAALRQIMRLRGFSVMTNVLDDYVADDEVKMLALECMKTWPLIQRNKVEDSKVTVPVKQCTSSQNEALASLANTLLSQWEGLEYAYRIPKRVKVVRRPSALDSHTLTPRPCSSTTTPTTPTPPRARARPPAHVGRRGAAVQTLAGAPRDDYPEFKLRDVTSSGIPLPLPPQPLPVVASYEELESARRAAARRQRKDVAAIIAQAAKDAEEAQRVAEQEAKVAAQREALENLARVQAQREKRERREARERERERKAAAREEEREANKEKRLLKLVGAVVVKCMSKHKDKMDHEQFKKHAKELTQVIADKEKKSTSYKEGKLDALSDEKVIKIKKFAKEYIAKVLRKLEKSGSRRKQPSTAASSSTPDSRADKEDTLIATAIVDDLMDIDATPVHDDSDDDAPLRQEILDGPSGSGTPDDAMAGSGETSPTVVSDPRIRRQPDKMTWDGGPGLKSQKIADSW
ncbi:SET domain-containing protein [Epithele typhae]|uniref:SET domain-containing protein n=1 Tax=Epithele typhae TaxID=378194 RepID=UPI0020072DC6|nr:SET domain-containing protein [Epithele typhae]KAH9920885.1 SET domain-containing protein [Epithele typhae]